MTTIAELGAFLARATATSDKSLTSSTREGGRGCRGEQGVEVG
jgi:hypothetical protein